MTERIGAHAYTDAAPNTAGNTYVGKGYFGTNTTTSCVVGNYTDAEVNSIQPLSSDTTMLKRRIDKLVTGGSTAGHLGTAWAWYLLSPNWNTAVDGLPDGIRCSTLQRPDGQELQRAPKLRKIAVLMTDGDYNINYCKGVEAKNSNQTPGDQLQLRERQIPIPGGTLCTAIKNAKSRCTRSASK